MMDKETKEVVSRVDNKKYKKIEEEREKQKRDTIEKNIRNIMKEYSIDRHDAELYLKHKDSESTIVGMVMGCIMLVMLVLCCIELFYGPGYWLRVLGLY